MKNYTKSCKLRLMKPQKQHKPEWDSSSIQALRRHLNLTQRQMADELGTRQQTISEWETGMYKPRGASATLLTMIAERANFVYGASEGAEPSQDVV